MVANKSVENQTAVFEFLISYELGVSYGQNCKTTICFHAKYGLSVMYNNLRPTGIIAALCNQYNQN
jgi:hypothetical protein